MSDDNITSKSHDSFDLLILCVIPKYKVNSKIQWAETDACHPTLYIKKGVISINNEPIKEYESEFVNFLNILNEKKSCK